MKFTKLTENLKNQLKKAALLLRFRTTSPTFKSRKYISYKNISNILKLSTNVVQYICIKAFKPPKVLTLKKKARLLDQEHIDFLLSPNTLE